jgi:predicted metal-dependent phosphoesterase TrpH
VLKADLHIHTADDPIDSIPHTTVELINRAASLGFAVLAITLHERQLDTRPLVRYAADRAIVLVPGVERTIEGKHVLLLNFREGADAVNTFEELARLKRRDRGIVIAPHPFFPTGSCLRAQMDRNAALFDAVEWNAMFTRHIDFNRPAARWAAAHGKPLVGNGDVHRLAQLGTTFSWIDAEPDPESICAAIVAGRVSVDAQPLDLAVAVGIFADLILSKSKRPEGAEEGVRSAPVRDAAPVRVSAFTRAFARLKPEA